MASFQQLADSLAGAERGAAFHTLVKERRIPAALARYLLTCFSSGAPDAAAQGGGGGPADAEAEAGGALATVAAPPKPGSEEWKRVLALPGAAVALQLLGSLVKGQPVRRVPDALLHSRTRPDVEGCEIVCMCPNLWNAECCPQCSLPRQRPCSISVSGFRNTEL